MNREVGNIVIKCSLRGQNWDRLMSLWASFVQPHLNTSPNTLG